MATANQAATLITIAGLLDQYNKRSHLTLLFSGVQGIGKSEAIYNAAKKLNGYADVIDGSILGEGELGGIPFKKKSGINSLNINRYVSQYKEAIEALKAENLNPEDLALLSDKIADKLLEANQDFTEELDFAKYPKIMKIEKLQEFYYNKLKKDGFTLPSGIYKIDEFGNEIIINSEGSLIIKEFDERETYADSGKNKFTFGEDLSPEDRIHLLITGQIPMYFTLIDELNRPEQYTMSNMMNLVLNRTVNGYNIPWWVCLVGAQNPSGYDSEYSTIALDPAQLNRFAYIDMNASLEDWAIKSLTETDPLTDVYVNAVANGGDKFFSPDDLKDRKSPTIKPSPRSHTVAGTLIKYFDKIMSLPCFSDDERREKDFYKRIILTGLLGSDATNTLLVALEDSTNMITIKDILNGESNKIALDVVSKIKNKSIISQKILVMSLIDWLCKNWLKIKNYKRSADPELLKQYSNYLQQLAELVGMLNPSIMNYFCEMINTKTYDITQEDGTIKSGANLIRHVYEIVQINPNIAQSYETIKNLQFE